MTNTKRYNNEKQGKGRRKITKPHNEKYRKREKREK